jgi:hypothetical protein
VAAACSGSGARSAPATSTVAAPEPTSVAAPAPTEPTTAPTTVAGHPRPVTTVAGGLGPGGARLAGTVVGPGGPVPGASVRVERLAGTGVASTTVQSGPGGQWGIEAVNGGRYRLRAWRVPDLDQLTPTLVFVVATETKVVDLAVTRYGDGTPVASVTPDPPVLNQLATLTVTVAGGTVDAEGVLHSQPRQGVAVQLVLTGGLVLSSPGGVATDPSGNAGFSVTCVQPGPPSLSAVVDGVPHPLAVTPCAPG